MPELRPRAAFADLQLPQSDGVLVTERIDLGIATVLARKGHHAALRTRLIDRFGIEVPEGPARASVREVSVVATGPGAWLAMANGGTADAFAASLRDAVAGLASVSDQRDAYAVLRIEGAKAREALQKLVFIDLHERAFKPGAAASTAAGHIGVILWRLDDAPDGRAVFEIAVYRSFAGSFSHALCAIMRR